VTARFAVGGGARERHHDNIGKPENYLRWRQRSIPAGIKQNRTETATRSIRYSGEIVVFPVYYRKPK